MEFERFICKVLAWRGEMAHFVIDNGIKEAA